VKDQVRSLFNKVSNRIEGTRTEEKQLEKEEEQERKYVRDLEGDNSQEDLNEAIELFLEEVNMAKDIEENLLAAEKDEINIIDRIGTKNEPEILTELDSTEKNIEELVKIFVREVKSLHHQGKKLQNMIQTSPHRTETENNLKESLNYLDNVEENLSELKNEAKEMKMGRRKFLEGSASLATGAGFQSLLDKKEPKEKSPEPGVIEEILQIEEINLAIKAETVRTSQNSALVVFKINNNSQTDRKIELDVDLGKWAASGTSYIEGGPQEFQSQFNIRPGKTVSSALTIYEPSESYEAESGTIRFKLTGKNWERNMSIIIPKEVTNHEISNSRNIPNFDLGYDLKTINSSQAVKTSRKAAIEAKNTSDQVLEGSICLNYPSGWYKSSIKGDFDQAATGLVVGQLREINPGEVFELITELHRRDNNAPKIGTINITYFPKNQPEKAEYYIIPFNLEG